MRWLLTGALLSGAVLPRAEAADLPEVLKRGTLRALVVVSEEEAYFVSSRPDAPPGFDAEVLEGFARLHKLKLAIVPVSGWDTLIPSLLKGKGAKAGKAQAKAAKAQAKAARNAGGKGVREPQPLSDAQLRDSIVALTAIQGQLAGANTPAAGKATVAIGKAIQELRTALTIR